MEPAEDAKITDQLNWQILKFERGNPNKLRSQHLYIKDIMMAVAGRRNIGQLPMHTQGGPHIQRAVVAKSHTRLKHQSKEAQIAQENRVTFARAEKAHEISEDLAHTKAQLQLHEERVVVLQEKSRAGPFNTSNCKLSQDDIEAIEASLLSQTAELSQRSVKTKIEDKCCHCTTSTRQCYNVLVGITAYCEALKGGKPSWLSLMCNIRDAFDKYAAAVVKGTDVVFSKFGLAKHNPHIVLCNPVKSVKLVFPQSGSNTSWQTLALQNWEHYFEVDFCKTLGAHQFGWTNPDGDASFLVIGGLVSFGGPLYGSDEPIHRFDALMGGFAPGEEHIPAAAKQQSSLQP